MAQNNDAHRNDEITVFAVCYTDDNDMIGGRDAVSSGMTDGMTGTVNYLADMECNSLATKGSWDWTVFPEFALMFRRPEEASSTARQLTNEENNFFCWVRKMTLTLGDRVS